ncbi:helix-turn-helix domain-containing protein [Chryseobacterium sp. JJR-5R]|uniref:helix-turn-helix domain-containing protein n=1 Tax=Chryseobacterium sp. JJR-5R TaxID=3093923 RepID=UPI002A75F9C6|nr:helix-turn-helix domain-containing protein [Chryseobacterium sp. JJR-5R]WPO84426.1 helix-turn-helix domain-containing protein [Chryseobacterium sp. JJR-5R]
MITEGVSFSGIVAAFFCSALLLSKKKNLSSDFYLMAWLWVAAVNLAYYLFPALLPDQLQPFGFALPVLSVGMLYLYVVSLTFNIKFRLSYFIKHSLFFILYSSGLVIFSAFCEKIAFKNGIPYFMNRQSRGMLDFLTFPMAVVPVVYIVLCFLALKKYQKKLPEYYSALEKISLNWLKYILVSLIILFISVSLIIALGSKLKSIPPDKIFKIVAVIQSLYVWCIIFFSLRQSLIFNQQVVMDDSAADKKDIKTDSKDKNRSAEISESLLMFMETERPYLDEELSLQKLSLLVNISAHRLSEVINQDLNTNFYRLINAYRVEEVKKKLRNPEFDKYSILGIAFESGFNSKSTFNKIFKEETGMTPSEFKKSGSSEKSPNR